LFYFQTGLQVHFDYKENKVAKTESRSLLFHVHSPLEVLRLVHVNGSLARTNGSYRLILDGAAGNNTADVDVFFKVCNRRNARVQQVA
jgi:hypothetical protein